MGRSDHSHLIRDAGNIREVSRTCKLFSRFLCPLSLIVLLALGFMIMERICTGRNEHLIGIFLREIFRRQLGNSHLDEKG